MPASYDLIILIILHQTMDSSILTHNKLKSGRSFYILSRTFPYATDVHIIIQVF